MERNELPLIKRCMERAEEFEKDGDTANAEKWLGLAEKAEQYYEKQGWKTADELYHIYDEFQEK
jgi:hypothetical protein